MGRQPLGEQALPRQGWSVKGADRDLTQELRLQAIREGRNVGACLNEAIARWLESRKGSPQAADNPVRKLRPEPKRPKRESRKAGGL